jgi:hypothetical protein
MIRGPGLGVSVAAANPRGTGAGAAGTLSDTPIPMRFSTLGITRHSSERFAPRGASTVSAACPRIRDVDEKASKRPFLDSNPVGPYRNPYAHHGFATARPGRSASPSVGGGSSLASQRYWLRSGIGFAAALNRLSCPLGGSRLEGVRVGPARAGLVGMGPVCREPAGLGW